MPIDINGAVNLTDNNGELAIVLQENGNYSIISGMPGDTGNKAIEFPEIINTGRNLADLSASAPIDIEMTRNIEIERPVCRSTISGVEFVQFFFNNKVNTPLQVPLTYNKLNQMLSPQGDQTPIELFPSGSNFFYLPLSGFQAAGTYVGQWNFVGQSTFFSGLPEQCTGGGDPDCTPINQALLDDVKRFFQREVFRQFAEANRLANRTWFPNQKTRLDLQQGRLVIIRRNQRVLRKLSGMLDDYENTLVCTEPTSCRTFQLKKGAIASLLSDLFEGNPRGLESLAIPKEAKKRALNRLLKDLPDEVSQCD